MKIALPSRRQCNVIGSGTLEKHVFLSFWGVKLRVQSGTHQRWSKNGTLGCLGGSQEGSKGENGFHQGPPRTPPGIPRGSKIESKSRSFSQWPKVGSKTSPWGRPGDHLGSIFGDFWIDGKQYLVSLLVLCLVTFEIDVKQYFVILLVSCCVILHVVSSVPCC